jgi:hypothetical protein
MTDRKHKIGYIDEDRAEVRAFKRFAKNDFDIMDFEINADTTIDGLFQSIMKSDISALVIDYDLKETNIIRFNGDEVVNKVIEELYNFPLFILTSYEGDALDAVEDVDIVYDKELMENKRGMLIKRIRNKIENYHDRLEEAEKELLRLIKKKDKDGLSHLEEDRLIELDNFLQHSISKKDRLPTYLKQPGGLKKLDNLINKTEELLKEMRKKNDQV